MHWLRNIDPATRRGVCAVCGPVAVKRRGGGYWRCGAQESRYRREQRERKRAKAAEVWEASARLDVTTPCCEVVVTLPAPDNESQSERFHTVCACGRDWIVQRDRFDFGDGIPLDAVEWVAQMEFYESGRLAQRSCGQGFHASRQVMRTRWASDALDSSS